MLDANAEYKKRLAVLKGEVKAKKITQDRYDALHKELVNELFPKPEKK